MQLLLAAAAADLRGCDTQKQDAEARLERMRARGGVGLQQTCEGVIHKSKTQRRA